MWWVLHGEEEEFGQMWKVISYGGWEILAKLP